MKAAGWLSKHECPLTLLATRPGPSHRATTPLGPFVNIASGLTGYSWPRFLLYDLLGEALWVALYVLLGRFFSDRVEEMSNMLGDFTWAAVWLLLAALLGWSLWRQLRAPSPKELKASES